MSCEGNWEHFKSFYKGNLTFLHLVSILLLGLIFYSFLCPISYTSQWRWCLNALGAPAHFHLVQKSVINKNSDLFVCITPTAIYLKNVPLFLSVNTTNPFWRCLCVFHLFQNIFRTAVRSKWNIKMSSNSFGRKALNLCPAAPKMLYNKIKITFFLVFCVCVYVCVLPWWFQQVWKTISWNRERNDSVIFFHWYGFKIN